MAYEVDGRLTDKLQRDLQKMSLDEMHAMYGRGEVRTHYLEPRNGYAMWLPGDGRPAVVAESPAVAQAMGRCVVSRLRWDGKPAMFDSVHVAGCNWCDFEPKVLLAALDHAAYLSRCIEVETESWLFVAPPATEYIRSTNREGDYDNPEWREFFALSVEQRRRAIEVAARGATA